MQHLKTCGHFDNKPTVTPWPTARLRYLPNLWPWPTRGAYEDDCAECKFTPVFLFRLATWAATLQWDTNTSETTSLFELMLSYIYTTNSYPPYPLRKYPNNANNRAQHWVLRDLHPKMDLQGFDCSDLLSGFTRWCANLLVGLFFRFHLEVVLICLRVLI